MMGGQNKESKSKSQCLDHERKASKVSGTRSSGFSRVQLDCKTDELPLRVRSADHIQGLRSVEISTFRAPRLVPYSLSNAADKQALSTILLDMYIGTASANCSEILTNPPHLS